MGELDDLLAPLAPMIAPDYVAGPVTGAGVFTGSPNAAVQFEETFIAPTDVLTAFDGTEQRIQLRGQPLRRFRYRLTQLDEIETAELMAKLYKWVGQMIAVPAWSDAMALLYDVAVDATRVYVDPLEPAYALGGSMMLWSNRWTYEFVTFSGTYLDAPTTLAWKAGSSFLVPMVQMVFVGDPVLSRGRAGFSTIDLVFESDLSPWAG